MSHLFNHNPEVNMNQAERARAYAERVNASEYAYACWYGHVDCAARAGGPCLDEMFSAAGLDCDGNCINDPVRWDY